LNDNQLLTALESGTLVPGTLDHRQHVRAAWCLLERYPLLEALSRMREGLRRFVTKAGAADKYHETITTALMLIIHERTIAQPCATFDEFETANPDLLEWQGGALLAPYYRKETLYSDLARAAFVLPDRAPATAELHS
jgi:hypothetical protein